MLKTIENIVKESNYDVGVYISDTRGNEIKYNENKKFEAASCIKLFILIEYFKQVYEKKIKIDDTFTYNESDNIEGINSGIISSLDYGLKLTSKDYATLMIIYSDNIATNKLIEFLGIENINNTIRELGFKDTILFNKLDLLKYFKFGQTTPYEYAKAYKMILNNEIVNEEVSKNILEVLKKQKHNDMLVKGLDNLDVLFKGTDKSNINFIASKSGTIISIIDELKNVRNDGGIISTIYGNYIISLFISDIDDLQFNYDNKAIELGGKVSEVVYKSFIENKGELR